MIIITKKSFKHRYLTAINPVRLLVLAVLSVATISAAHATISCAGYLPNSYFERIDNDKVFAGKLVTLQEDKQQLQSLNDKVLIDNLTNSYVLMETYLLAQRDGKYGVVTAAGEIVVPFAYDDIQTEPDIATSFIVSIDTDTDTDTDTEDFNTHASNVLGANVYSAKNLSKQGIIDRDGYWIYPKPSNSNQTLAEKLQGQQPSHSRVDNGYGKYSVYSVVKSASDKAVNSPYNLALAAISHAHYDSVQDRDYFLIKSSEANAGKLEESGLDVSDLKTGLLDDQGSWIIAQQYDELVPLNPCTGQRLYLQARLQQQTALLDEYNQIIIPFASHQHIESFNNNASPLLFLRSDLIAGSTGIGMSEDIQDEIISAQIIDANGKVQLSSEAPITKLLYHQLYAYQQAGQYGFVGDQAHIILTPQFESYHDEGDKVWVEKQGKRLALETLIQLD